MNEPISWTDVVDAFDDNDVFDVNISVGYQRTWEMGTIQRQDPTPGMTPGTMDDGRMTLQWNDISRYERALNQLNFQLDVGIFRDLAAYARLPLVLSDDRTLAGLSGASSRLTDGTPGGAALFDATFRSPTRSGVDHLAAGLAWSITNQHRDRTLPTWLVMVEGQFNLGEPMHACGTSANTQGGNGTAMMAGATQCGNQFSNPMSNMSPGVGRGFNFLRAETRASYRYESIEPYAGLAFQIGWPGYSSNSFLPQGNLQGYINQIPPIFGGLTVGAAIIPWENREQYQRLTLDLRLVGNYISEGHDYSPLFDALGTSNNPYLVNENLQGVPLAPGDSRCDSSTPGGNAGYCNAAGLASVPFYGLTDTQSHSQFGGTFTIEMRAARYVRFGASVGFLYSPPYGLTVASPCNPNVSQGGGTDPRLIGTCHGGIINPAHRSVIDLPGNQFRILGSTQVDINVWATAMF